MKNNIDGRKRKDGKKNTEDLFEHAQSIGQV